jgi:archaellum biogenesis protein FlaJ (TadC family)
MNDTFLTLLYPIYTINLLMNKSTYQTLAVVAVATIAMMLVTSVAVADPQDALAHKKKKKGGSAAAAAAAGDSAAAAAASGDSAAAAAAAGGAAAAAAAS